MSERFFRLIIGSVLLSILYFELHQAIPVLLTLLILEGISKQRISLLVTRWRLAGQQPFADSSEFTPVTRPIRFDFDAERAWRITVASMLAVAFYLFAEQLWFFPWFMGFAIFGAGLSGVCPVLITLKLIGFR